MITQLPTADAGDDQTVSLVGGLPTQVVLNGSASIFGVVLKFQSVNTWTAGSVFDSAQSM